MYTYLVQQKIKELCWYLEMEDRNKNINNDNDKEKNR